MSAQHLVEPGNGCRLARLGRAFAALLGTIALTTVLLPDLAAAEAARRDEGLRDPGRRENGVYGGPPGRASGERSAPQIFMPRPEPVYPPPDWYPDRRRWFDPDGRMDGPSGHFSPFPQRFPPAQPHPPAGRRF